MANQLTWPGRVCPALFWSVVMNHTFIFEEKNTPNWKPAACPTIHALTMLGNTILTAFGGSEAPELSYEC